MVAGEEGGAGVFARRAVGVGILGSFGRPWVMPTLLSDTAPRAPTMWCGNWATEEGPPAGPPAVSLSLPQPAGHQVELGLPPTQP